MAVKALPAAAVDAGTVPASQPVTMTVYLAPSADRTSALDSFLTAVQTTASPQYHQWLTPAAFAQQFGATEAQVASVKDWAAQQGLAIGSVSASGTFLTVSGTATQIEAAMAPGLHTVQLAGQTYVANTAVPTLPAAVQANVLAIGGLSTVPATHALTIKTEAARTAASDLLSGLSDAVEANASRLLSLTTDACVEDADAATLAAAHLLLKEAAAEGITTLATSGCNGRGSASLMGSLAEAVSVAAAPEITPATAPTLTEVWPAWQNAAGVPQDGFRHEPDVTVSSQAALEDAVLQILAKMQTSATDGSVARLGNIAGTLYAMAPIAGLYTQPDAAAADTWEAATGLGVVNLPLLIKSYATGTATVGTTIVPTGPGSSNAYTITYGGNQTYAITVTGQQGAPTGTVTVTLATGGATVGTASVALTASSATASTGTFQLSQLATPPAAPANYTVLATYNGDNTYRAGDAGQTSVYVNPAPITITASAASSSGTLFVGGQYIVAVSLAAGSTTPTANVTITPSPGTAQTLSYPQGGSTTATATFTATAAGTININVTCTPGTNYVCNTPASTSVPVNKATPTISMVSITNISATGATLSVTLTGATGATPPSGTVTFTDSNNTTLCTTANSTAITGSVSCTSTNFPGTTSGTITATYAGDASYNGITSTGTYTGSVVTTKTALATITTPQVVGTTVNLVATITPASNINNTPPSGTITWFDNNAQIAQQTVANYQTSYTASVPLNTVGTNAIYATYSGDTNYGTSMSATQNVTVAAAPSVVVTATPAGNISYGNTVTLNAVISGVPNNGAATLTGSIKFNVNGTDAATQTVGLTSATGTGATATATFTQALDVGTYTVNLYCTGTNFDCSSFNTTPFTFNVVKVNSVTMVQVIPATYTKGQSVYAMAVIAPATKATGTAGVITGNVTFYDNANNVGTVSVYQSNGQYIATSAAFTVSSASDNVVAVYNGDGNYNSSTSNGGTTGGGTPASTVTTVTATPLTALNGGTVGVSATVVGTPANGGAAASPTGTVNFYDNYNGTQFLLGSATLAASGTNTSTAVLYTTGLRDGANIVTATFVGSTLFTTSASSNTVTVQITDYSVSLTPTTLNVTAGQSGKATVAVNAVNGFTGTVTLGCSTPSGAAMTCSLDTTKISTSGLATLTIGTTVRSGSEARGTFEAAVGAAGALLLCLLIPAGRRRRLQLLAVAVLVVLGTTVGCTELHNAANSGTGLGSGTPAGAEVVTISTAGTDGTTTVNRNYTITVNVQ